MNEFKQKRSEQLGMPYGTASNKLRLKVIFDLLCSVGKNNCFVCNSIIDSPENLAVAHKKQWVDVDPSLFWKTDNIVFKHQKCKEKNNMIEITLVNENGKELKKYSHDGEVWIAGNSGDRYNLLVKNKSSDRIEVICSVDGRDVICGEEANYKTQRGYIVNPYGTCLIKGFRQNNNEVAAFKFSESKNSYSAKMGTPENVGIIGVAVFREKRVPIIWHTYNINNIQHPYYYSNTRNFWRDAEWPGTKITCDASTSGTPPTHQRKRVGTGILRSCEIGTEYGETINSSVLETVFNRENKDTPTEILTIRYDSLNGLRSRGINVDEPIKINPNPFPGVDNVLPGFAQRPPK